MTHSRVVLSFNFQSSPPSPCRMPSSLRKAAGVSVYRNCWHNSPTGVVGSAGHFLNERHRPQVPRNPNSTPLSTLLRQRGGELEVGSSSYASNKAIRVLREVTDAHITIPYG